MTIFVNPWVALRDPDTDAPASGGKLHFFLSGTTTAVNVYSDAALTVSLGAVVTCDSYGQPTTAIYLDPANSYKVIVTDSDGDTSSPLWPTIDPYDPNGKAEAQFADESGAAYTVISADRGQILRRTHSSAMSDQLPTAASVGNGFFVTVRNITSAYNLTLTVASSGTIDGASSLIVYPGQDRVLRSNGSVWYADPAALTGGKRAFSLPAGAWAPTTTNGCAAVATGESSSNKVNYEFLAFDASSDEYAYATTYLSKSYLAGTLEFKVIWTAAAGTAAETVIWKLDGLCRSDDDAIDTAYGTAATASDAYIAAGDVHETAWTAVTPASDAADRWLALRVMRDAVTDSKTGDAHLMAVVLRWSLVRSNDA